MDAMQLRIFETSDIPQFEKWLYTPHVAKWYHDPLDWLEEVKKRNSAFRWLHHFIAEKDGRPVGFCQYYAYCDSGETWHGNTQVAGTYSIDYLIGEADCLRKGIGVEIVKALIKKIKAHEDARRIIVQPEPENKASCNTLLSCGFRFLETQQIFLMEFPA